MASSGGSAGGAVPAWDLPTRLFHWALVFCIVSAWVSYRYAELIGDTLLKWHRWNGYAILLFLTWRLLWGFFGSSTSRFASFVRAPSAIGGYAGALARGNAPQYLGHNPLGSLMILALLLAAAVQGSLGLFAVDETDLTGGALHRLVSEGMNKSLTRWHAWTFYYVLLALAGLHIAINLLYGLVKREPLIAAMITGRKPEAAYVDAPRANIAERTAWRALACLAAAAAIVFGTIAALGGRLL